MEIHVWALKLLFPAIDRMRMVVNMAIHMRRLYHGSRRSRSVQAPQYPNITILFQIDGMGDGYTSIAFKRPQLEKCGGVVRYRI